MNYLQLAEEVLLGRVIGRAEAVAMLRSTDDELLGLLDGAFRLRWEHFGRGVKLHVIRNARSGRCGEDCAYCGQSSRAGDSAPAYPLQGVEEILAGAQAAHQRQAIRYCIVTSGRRLSAAELETVCAAVRRIRAELPLSVCTSLGSLTGEQAARLAAAGVQRYNHNLESVPRVFRLVCGTHTCEDRQATIAAARAAGMEICSGGILGLGESLEERAELALLLREVGAAAIPVNFLDPRQGTPLAGRVPMTPHEALRALAMFRFVHPRTELRVAGGRERVLGPVQALALYVADSIFTEGYLTTAGQGYAADLALLQAAGFEPAGLAE